MTARATKGGTRPSVTAARGRHVIDLTEVVPPVDRIADYRDAFGFPSPLHDLPTPTPPSRRGPARLRWRKEGRARR